MPLITKAQAIRSGIPKKTLQTILIPKSYTLKESRDWLKQHDYATSYYRLTTNFRRWMQTPPIKGATYKSIKLDNGVELVYQHF